MGACDSLSRSVTLPRFTDCPEEVAREAGALLRALRLPFAAIRGLGLQVTRLDSDAAAAGARPHAAAPARAAAPPATRHDPHAPNPWGGFFAAAAGAAGAAAAPAEAPQAAERASEGASDAGWATDSGAQQQAQQEQQEQASPAPRGGTPQRRTPGKLQVSLRAALRRAAPPSPAGDGAGGGGAAADEEGGGELRAADRRRLLERYEGLTLTQVDAAELAALPWEVQKELVETLPRSRAALAMAAAAAGGTVPPSSPAPLGPPSSAQPAAAGGGGGGGGGGTPIVALPARSQVDPAVLAALPADVRRELEAAYGMAPPRRAGPKRAGGAGAGASGGRSKRREAAAVSKRQRLDSFVANPPPYGGAAARRVVAAPAAITLSQIDPGVLSALPEELRREVLAQVAPPPPPLLRGRSRLGAGAAAAADAASERRRLQEVQDAQLQGSASEGEEEACGGGGEAGGAAELPPAAAAFLEAAHAAAQPATGAALCALLERLHPCLEALEAAEDPPASPQPSPSWAGAGSPASMLPGQPASDVVPATQPIVASANSPAALQRSTSASPSRSAAPATARARQLGAGVAALEAWLAAAARPLVAHDLEGARDVLLRVQDLGARHPCFADAAARAAGRLQRRVRRRYGLPLSTARLLAAGGGSTPA
jgi:DNA repair protein REV1